MWLWLGCPPQALKNPPPPPQLQPASLIAPSKPFLAERQPLRRETVAQAASSGAGATPEPSKKFMGFDSFTWSKIAALGAMFFCILFNYTILRDTKVGIVLKPGGGRRTLCMDMRAGPLNPNGIDGRTARPTSLGARPWGAWTA